MKKVKGFIGAAAVIGAGLAGITGAGESQLNNLSEKGLTQGRTTTAQTTTEQQQQNKAEIGQRENIPIRRIPTPNFAYLHVSNPPKVYGQWLQSRGKQKWTKPKKSKRC